MQPPTCILGTGASGRAAARLLASRGCGGWVCDENNPTPETLKEFEDLGFAWREGGPPAEAERLVLSPGFAVEHPWLSGTVEKLPEFELGARSLRGRILAVTGSLGKTTLVMLAAELLRAHGCRVTLSGNIGTPVSEIALNCPEADWHVMELSSFQTEQLQSFRSDIGLLINLFPNHLDRHGSFERYAAAKLRMFARQTEQDTAVLPFPWATKIEGAAHVRTPDPETLPDVKGTRFDTPALRENLTGLFTALRDLELNPQRVREVLERFEFPPYRMREPRIPGAGRVINDSKSTCLTATRAALQSVSGPVCLFVGGMGKGEDPGILREELGRGDVKLFLFGRDGPRFAEAWEGVPVYCGLHDSLKDAVEDAFLHRQKDEPLLFSPGCASFDQYPGFSARGEDFERLVRAAVHSQESVCLDLK